MANEEMSSPSVVEILQKILESSEKNLKASELILAELQVRNDDAGTQVEEQVKAQAEAIKKTAVASAQAEKVLAGVMKTLQGMGHGFR